MRDCYRFNRPIPEAIQNAPTLDLTGAFYFNAYQELSTTREFDGGRIPWGSVINYGRFYGMSPQETEDLFTVVSQLDQMIRDEAEKKAGKDKPTKGKKGRGIGS